MNTFPQSAQQQEPVALLNAIRAEPTEMIHKWKVIDIIQSTPPQGIYYTPPASKPLTDDEIITIARKHVCGGLEFDSRESLLAFFKEAANGIKKKKPLTDEQIMNIAPVKMTESMRALVRAIEKAHGIEPELPF